jgi:hypothetical protein
VLPPTEQFLGTLDRVAAVGSSLDNSVQVPNERLILDTEELELVGDGLPIIHGVSNPTSLAAMPLWHTHSLC